MTNQITESCHVIKNENTPRCFIGAINKKLITRVINGRNDLIGCWDNNKLIKHLYITYILYYVYIVLIGT